MLIQLIHVDKLACNKFKNVPSTLSSLRSKVDKQGIGKLETSPVDLSKLSYVVKNDIVKKDIHNAHIKNNEDKIPDISTLANNASLNVKINEVKKEIPNITNLATIAALTTVDLVIKADYDAKISKMEKNILLLLIIISLRVIHLMQR